MSNNKSFSHGCVVMEDIQFDHHYSIIKTKYLGYSFCIPVYAWEALAPFWGSIAIAISKALIYNRFSLDCYKDHHLWRDKRMGWEALRLVDVLTRDRDFRKAIREFNAQVPKLKYGEWLKVWDTGQSVNFENHLAQLGQLTYNSVKFLLDAEYLRVYGELVKIIRPYWIPPAEWALRRDWQKQTIDFIEKFLKENKKYPSLKKIADQWSVPRHTLIEAGFTRDTIYDMYRHYKKTNEIKIIKPEKEYKIPSEEEQKQIADRIVKRVFGR